MAATGKRARRGVPRIDTGSHWISFSDMLSGLLLVFILAVTFSIYHYFSMLELKTKELDEQQVALDRAQLTLVQREEDLETTRVKLMGKEEELASVQIQLDQQRDDLHAAQTALKTEKEEAAALQLRLTEQSEALAGQEIRLGALQEAMAAQQRQIDDLLGVRTSIILELSRALARANVSAQVDKATGDIVLDSSQLKFETAKFVITPEGRAQLDALIPVYLDVIMRPEYSAYLAEIIIEGHTDSQGSYMTNLQLSQNRALAVAEYCLEMSRDMSRRTKLQGILTAKGRSYADPVLYPDGTENMDASRRVEIKFRLKDSEMIARMSEILSEGPLP